MLLYTFMTTWFHSKQLSFGIKPSNGTCLNKYINYSYIHYPC